MILFFWGISVLRRFHVTRYTTANHFFVSTTNDVTTHYIISSDQTFFRPAVAFVLLTVFCYAFNTFFKIRQRHVIQYMGRFCLKSILFEKYDVKAKFIAKSRKYACLTYFSSVYTPKGVVGRNNCEFWRYLWLDDKIGR